jgi:hypothetical protein
MSSDRLTGIVHRPRKLTRRTETTPAKEAADTPDRMRDRHSRQHHIQSNQHRQLEAASSARKRQRTTKQRAKKNNAWLRRRSSQRAQLHPSHDHRKSKRTHKPTGNR